MNILVISGFLGAGKTTFIRELASRTHRDFVVMENEYGEVGIDGPVLAQDGSDSATPLNIWEMTEGCVCCSTKSDFATSILTISNTLDPEYLIVEPTGVGMLSRVMENIRQIQYERITLLNPVTILDGHSFERYHKEFHDIYRNQIASAGTILVSKMENEDVPTLLHLEQKLREINPNAEIFTQHYKKNSQEWWESLLSCTADGTPLPPTPEQQLSALENIGLTNVQIASTNALILFLQGVTAGVFGDICRAKGYLCVGEQVWLRFDVVDHQYTITGTSDMPDSRAVFIGKNLKRNLLREVLQKKMWISPIKQKKAKSNKDSIL